MNPQIGKEQTGEIRISGQIVEQLSHNLYNNPESAIKELVVNSYDADATKVIIDSESVPNCLTIYDDGVGMTYEEFSDNFTFISKSSKLVGKKSSIYGRPIVGRFGIGFISVADLCDTMIISSASKKSQNKFVAIIDFTKFRNNNIVFEQVNHYKYTIYENKKNESYTRIELHGLDKTLKESLKKKSNPKSNSKKLPYEHVLKKIWNSDKFTKIDRDYGPYWKFITHLASILPVEYISDNNIIDPEYKKIINEFSDTTKKLQFEVIFDGMKLKKPYLFPTSIAKSNNSYSMIKIPKETIRSYGNTITYSGYAYSQRSGIYAEDFRGLIVRIKNISVGTTSETYLDYPYLDTLYFKWVFVEIYVEEGLQESIHINRATFHKSDPSYIAFQQSLHEKLKSIVFNEIQKKWKEDKKQEKNTLGDYVDKWRNDSIRQTFNKKFIITEDNHSDKLISILSDQSKIIINPKFSFLEKFSKKERNLLLEVLIAAKLSRDKYPKNIQSQESFFYKLLNELSSKYPKTGLKHKYKKHE